METLIEYALKSAGVLLLFVAVYHLLLKRLTFFNANRWFLLAGLLASVVFPFIEITQTVYVEAPQEVFVQEEIATPMAFILEQQPIETPQIEPEPTIDLRLLAMYGYFAVVLFFLGKMAVELASLVKLIRSGAREKRGGFVFVSLSRKLTPFSFFNYICYSEQEKNHEELALIIDHEKVHARQWHSVDLLLSHLYRAFFWWNPLAWIAKKQIGENLEFIADAVAKRQHAHGHTYERALLSRAASHMQPALANNFFTPFIKQRIVMLQKEASATWNAYKYALILPVMLVFIYSFNRVQEIEYIEKESAAASSKLQPTVEELYNMFVGNAQEEGIASQKDSVKDSKNVHFKIIANTLDIDLKEYQEEVNANRPYQIKFENIKRDGFGRLESVIVACKFPDRPWNRDIKLVVEKGEINHFYIQEISFQIQRGATETDFFADSDGIQYMDRKKGETIKYDIYNKKKPVIEKFDTKAEVYIKIKKMLSNAEKDSEMPLLIMNDKIVDKETFKSAFEGLDGEAIGTFYNAKEATEMYGSKGKNGAWSLFVVNVSSTKIVKLGNNFSIRSINDLVNSDKTETATNYTYGLYSEPNSINYTIPQYSKVSSKLVGTTNETIYTINNTMSEKEILKIFSMVENETEGNFKLRTARYAKKKLVKLKFDWNNGKGSKKQLAYESNKGIRTICLSVNENDIEVGSCTDVQLSAQDREVQYSLVIDENSGDTPNKNSGYLYYMNGTYFYVSEDGETKIFNRWGVLVHEMKFMITSGAVVNGKTTINGKSYSFTIDKNGGLAFKDASNNVVKENLLTADETFNKSQNIVLPAGVNKNFVNSENPKPMFVIDGKIQDKKTGLPRYIEADIMTVKVLKGNEATSKYGDAGKDGVVEITTKGVQKAMEKDLNASENATTVYLKEFKIIFESSSNRLMMQSVKGTAWLDLSFSLTKNNEQAINEYGMTDLRSPSPSIESELANFLFTITKTDNGYVLKGIKGTAWTDLSFKIPNDGKVAVNQLGLTTLD